MNTRVEGGEERTAGGGRTGPGSRATGGRTGGRGRSVGWKLPWGLAGMDATRRRGLTCGGEGGHGHGWGVGVGICMYLATPLQSALCIAIVNYVGKEIAKGQGWPLPDSPLSEDAGQSAPDK